MNIPHFSRSKLQQAHRQLKLNPNVWVHASQSLGYTAEKNTLANIYINRRGYYSRVRNLRKKVMSSPAHACLPSETNDGEHYKIPFHKCVVDLIAAGEHPESLTRVSLDYDVPKAQLLIQADPDGHLLQHSPECPVHHQPAHINERDAAAANRQHIAVAVAVLIRNAKKEILLTRRPGFMRSFPGMWVIPGGGVDANEDLYEAGIREVFEETGLTIGREGLSLLGVWESCFPTRRELGPTIGHHIVVYMTAENDTPLSELLLQPHEVDMAGWFSPAVCTSIVNRTGAAHQVPVRRLSGYESYQQAFDNPHAPHVDEDTTHSTGTLTQRVTDADVLKSDFDMFDRISQGTAFAIQLFLNRE